MIRMRIGDKPLDLFVDDDPNLPQEIIGDMTRVKQIAINLLTNAVKFTRRGHIIFTIETEPTGTDEQFKLKMAVRDTGIGIRREEIPLLFGNFSQLDTRKNRGVEGTGLGLAISKNLVELMNGEIQVESVYGQGSCFSFYVMQRVENPKPAIILQPDERRRAALWFASGLRARFLSEKLMKMGVPCDIVDTPANFASYSHAFFDYNRHDGICEADCPDTELIAISQNPMDTQNVLQNMKTVHSPVTSLIAARLLDEKAYGQAYSQPSGLPITDENALSLEGTHLLVVDDNDINLIIAENVLRSYGGEVSTASSGSEAVELIKKNDYDMVFMDHMMPEMDGVDATRIIRALEGEKYAALPIVALTANVVGDVRDMFLQSGMNDFLSKPMESNEIERVLKEWLPRDKWSTAEEGKGNV
jgi:CheY-like chemotaxis protein